MTDLYVTTSIPYVNGAPHLGHALELVHVDVLARHRRRAGDAVRVQSGTDDHALKNVSAAVAEGVPVADLVRRNGDRFVTLASVLGVGTDEFLRTSSDPRHAAGVAALWTACERRGDLYRKDYTGLYCKGCEQFYPPDELVDGSCGEHTADQVVQVTETNWFFRLSSYRERLREIVGSGRLAVVPEERRNEVLGFLDGDVHDLSVSRPAERAGGWGVPVPGDPGQVVYVWFDALANYVTGLGYTGAGGDSAGVSEPEAQAPGFERWWCSPDVERTHVIGKGIVRFHAVYWPAFLLSAGLPLPGRILVHDYLTVDGAKIAKSGAQTADPEALVERFGQDAVRWWLLRDPARVGTSDFAVDRLLAAHDQDLANTVGNLVSRVVALAGRSVVRGASEAGLQTQTQTEPEAWRVGLVSEGAVQLAHEVDALPARVSEALADYDFRSACRAIVDVAVAANRLVAAEEPWLLARAAESGDVAARVRFEAVIGILLEACSAVADALVPFVPVGAQRLREQIDKVTRMSAGGGGRSAPVFPRLSAGA